MQAARKRVSGTDVQDFICGLLQLSFEDGDRAYSRAKIAGVADPDREESTSNYWANEKKLVSQFETHRAYMSEGLESHLLALERQTHRRPFVYRIGLIERETAKSFCLAGSIFRYRASGDVPRLSIVGKILHPGVGHEASNYRKWWFVAPALALILLIALLGVGMTLSGLSAATSWEHFRTYLMLGAAIAGLWYVLSNRWWRLLDDQTVILGTNEIKGGDEGVVLDRHRSEDGSRSVILRRYIADCPICDETSVIVAAGEPEWRMRIIGRCRNSPREHVFSFDRVTLEGAPLRSAPIASPD